MKKLISIICALTLVFGCVAVSATELNNSSAVDMQGYGSAQKVLADTVLVADDFNNYEAVATNTQTKTGTLANVLNNNKNNTGAEWTLSGNTNATGGFTSDGTSNYLYFYKGTNSRTYHVMNFANTVLGSDIEFSFKVRFPYMSVFNIQMISGSSYSNLINFKDTGSICLCDNGGEKSAASATYNTGEWVELKFAMDFSAHTYTATINNGDSVSGTLNISSLSGIRFDFNSSTAAKHGAGIDDFKIVRKGSTTTISKYSTIASNDFSSNTNGISQSRGTGGNHKFEAVNGELKISEAVELESGIWRVQLFKGALRKSGKVAIDFNIKSVGNAGIQMKWLGVNANGAAEDKVDAGSVSMVHKGTGTTYYYTTSFTNINHTTYPAANFKEYTPDKWYSIHMAADIERSTIDIAIDGEYIVKDLYVANIANGIDGFELVVSRKEALVEDADPVVCYVDNVYAYEEADLGTKLAEAYAVTTSNVKTSNVTVPASIAEVANGKIKEYAFKATQGTSFETSSLDLTGTVVADFSTKGKGSVKIAGTEVVAVDSSNMVDYRVVANGTTAKVYAGDIYKTTVTLPAALTSGAITFEAGDADLYISNINVKKAGTNHYEVVRTGISAVSGENHAAANSGTTYNAGVTIYNFTADTSYAPAVIVASYKADGTLENVDISTVDEINEGSISAKAKVSAGGIVRAFLWENMTTLKPIAADIILK